MLDFLFSPFSVLGKFHIVLIILLFIGVVHDLSRRILLSKLRKKYPKEHPEKLIDENSKSNKEKIKLVELEKLRICVTYSKNLFKFSLIAIGVHFFLSFFYVYFSIIFTLMSRS